MEDFKQRILSFIHDAVGCSTREFEKRCGLTNGSISSIGVQGPTASMLSKISETYPDLDMNWLFRGTGEMLLKREPPSSPSLSIGSIQTVNIGNWDGLVQKLAEILKQQ